MYNEKDIIAKWNADMYDENETDTEDVEFALAVIGREPKRILEIACGSGRFLVSLAGAGHTVVGLDFDEYMLDKIAAKAVALENVSWRRADVTRDEWGTGFDVVVLAANFLFNIVSDGDYAETQRRMIQKAAEALAPGGDLYIDYSYTLHPKEWFQNPKDNVVWEGRDSAGNGGRMILRNSTFDAKTNIHRFIRRFEMTLADGSSLVQEIPSEKHFVPLEQLHQWLEECGFVIEKEWGDYRGNPVGEETNRAILWARRKGQDRF